MKRNLFSFCLLLLGFFATGSAQAWIGANILLAKAEPDECYAGIGVDYPDGPPCPEGSVEKTTARIVFHVLQGPAGEVGAVNAPLLAGLVTLENEGALASTGQDEYAGVACHLISPVCQYDPGPGWTGPPLGADQ